MKTMMERKRNTENVRNSLPDIEEEEDNPLAWEEALGIWN